MSTFIDIQAPILPGEGSGCIKLRTSIQVLYGTISSKFNSISWKYQLDGPFYVKYEIQNTISLVFHILNGKLLKIGVFEKYEGTLFDNIRVGSSIGMVAMLREDLYFDEMEEMFFLRESPGISIETENPFLPVSDYPNEKIIAITVFIPEMHDSRWTKENELGFW